MACFYLEDVMIYDEIENTPTVAKTQGTAEVIQDVFGFFLVSNLTGTLAPSTLEALTFVYRARQVLANKETGSGYAIKAGDRLYYVVADDKVTPSATGTYGVDYYFCGWAKRDATADDLTVLMNFDGTRYDENL
jgi:hypothetical protein